MLGVPPMRKAILVLAAVALGWLLLGRRRPAHAVRPRVVVGFADGSSETLTDVLEHDLLVAVAEEALAG